MNHEVKVVVVHDIDGTLNVRSEKWHPFIYYKIEWLAIKLQRFMPTYVCDIMKAMMMQQELNDQIRFKLINNNPDSLRFAITNRCKKFRDVTLKYFTQHDIPEPHSIIFNDISADSVAFKALALREIASECNQLFPNQFIQFFFVDDDKKVCLEIMRQQLPNNMIVVALSPDEYLDY